MPSGTVVLRGARNENWIFVAVCLRSARRAIAALHPKQAHCTGARRNPRGKQGTSETSSVREWSGKAERMAFGLLG